MGTLYTLFLLGYLFFKFGIFLELIETPWDFEFLGSVINDLYEYIF